MGESKATTIRFSEDVYSRLEKASEKTGLPINSIVTVACLNWLAERPAGMLGMPGVPAMGPLRSLVPAVSRLFSRSLLEGPARAGYDFELLSHSAQQALSAAQEEARSAGLFIGTEHLRAVLLRVEGGVACKVLRQRGIGLEEVRARLAQPAAPERPSRLLPTRRFKRVVEAAYREARGASLAFVGTEPLLLGILQVGEGPAAFFLEEQGVTEKVLREQLAKLSTEA